MIYPPSELEKHRAALERLRRNDETAVPSPAGRSTLGSQVVVEPRKLDHEVSLGQ